MFLSLLFAPVKYIFYNVSNIIFHFKNCDAFKQTTS